MKYTTKAAEKSTVKITMEFDGTEWKDALNKAYLKTKGRFSVNGFRKGKAPRNVIEHAYGKGVFFEDALNVLFSENYGKILDKEEKKFTAVGDPELSVDDLSDEGVTLVAVTPVRPEVKIGSYKGMKIKEFAYTVKDADIDKELDRLRDRNARKVDVTDRPCQNGDIVNIDFVGTVDGVNVYLNRVEEIASYKRWFFGSLHMDKTMSKQHVAVFQTVVPVVESHAKRK